MRRGLSKMAVVLRSLMVVAALAMLAWGCASGATPSSTSTITSGAFGATSASITGPAATSPTGPAVPASTSTTARVSNPVTSRWPTGLEALVVQRTNGFAVVDDKGVRFAVAASGPRTGAGSGGNTVQRWRADVVVSPNDRYLAYRFGGGDLVVCSVADGKVLGTTATRPTDDVWALSDDGRYVLLIDWGEGPGVALPFPYPPPSQTVTVVDLKSGSREIPAAVADLVTARTHGDYWIDGAVWLPGEQVFLLHVSGGTGLPASEQTYRTYLYDPSKDTLTRVTGLDEVDSSTASRNGAVLGRTGVASSTAAGQSNESKLVAWQAGTLADFVFDPSWPGQAGAISPDGQSVVLGVGALRHGPGPTGWQAFRREGEAWRPSSKVWPLGSGQAQVYPLAVGADDRTAWGFDFEPLPADPADQHSYLVSLDMVTGMWTDWFRVEDLKVAPEEFKILQLLFL